MGFWSGDCDGHGRNFVRSSANHFLLIWTYAPDNCPAGNADVPTLNTRQRKARFWFKMSWYFHDALTRFPGTLGRQQLDRLTETQLLFFSWDKVLFIILHYLIFYTKSQLFIKPCISRQTQCPVKLNQMIILGSNLSVMLQCQYTLMSHNIAMWNIQPSIF